MSSRRTKLVALASAVVAGGALTASLAASSANAAPMGNSPSNMKAAAFSHHPRACGWDLGANTLDLTFQGNTFTYPVFLVASRDGAVTGVLFDKYLPGLLTVSGDCSGGNIELDVNYPSIDPQGSRAENLIVTPVPGHPHHGTVAGVWDETGSEAGSGAASFEIPLHR